jgi:hypothetical protein
MKSVLGQGAVQPGGSNLLGSALKGLTSTWGETKGLQSRVALEQLKHNLSMERQTHATATRMTADAVLEGQKNENKTNFENLQSANKIKEASKAEAAKRKTTAHAAKTSITALQAHTKGLYLNAGIEPVEGAISPMVAESGKTQGHPGLKDPKLYPSEANNTEPKKNTNNPKPPRNNKKSTPPKPSPVKGNAIKMKPATTSTKRPRLPKTGTATA